MYGFSYPGRHAAPRGDRAAAEPRRDLPGHDRIAVLRGLDVQRRRVRARVRGQLGRGACRTTRRSRPPRRAGDHAARGRRRKLRLVLAPARWPTRPRFTREDAPYYSDWLEHSAYDDYWHATAIDEDYSRIQVPGAPRRRLVRRLPRRARSRTSRGLARPAAGRSCSSGPGSTGPGTRCSAPAPTQGRPRRQRLAAALPRRGRQGPSERRLRRARDRLRHGRGLARPRRLAAVGLARRSTGSSTRAAGRTRSTATGRSSPEPPGDEPPDVFVYDPLAPVASAGGHSCCDDVLTPMGPRSQHGAERWGDTLVYTSAPLEARPRADRRRRRHAARGVDGGRHRLHGPALPGRPGREVGEPQGGHHPRPLPRVALGAVADRAGPGLRVPRSHSARSPFASRPATASASTSRAPTSRTGTAT